MTCNHASNINSLLFVCAGPLVQREALARIMLPLLQGIANLNQAHRDCPWWQELLNILFWYVKVTTKIVYSAGAAWWTSSLGRRRTASTADPATTRSLPLGAMPAETSSRWDFWKPADIFSGRQVMHTMMVLMMTVMVTTLCSGRDEEDGVQEQAVAREMFCLLHLQEPHRN